MWFQWRHRLNPKNHSESIHHPLCNFFEDMCSTILPQIAPNFSKLLMMSTVTLWNWSYNFSDSMMMNLNTYSIRSSKSRMLLLHLWYACAEAGSWRIHSFQEPHSNYFLSLEVLPHHPEHFFHISVTALWALGVNSTQTFINSLSNLSPVDNNTWTTIHTAILLSFTWWYIGTLKNRHTMIANEGLNWWASTCRERKVSKSQGSKIFINSSSNLYPCGNTWTIHTTIFLSFPWLNIGNSERHYDNNEGLNWWASICRGNLVRSKLPCDMFYRRMSMSKKERNLLTFAQILINLSPCFIPADHRVAMAERTNSPFALAFNPNSRVYR